MGLVLFDTNILIDHFNGIPEATDEIAYYRNTAISAITWAEVAVKLDTAGMAEFELLVAALPIYVLHTDNAIMRETARIRAVSIERNRHGLGRKLKTPDAIILATAHLTGRTLVTRNADDFVAAARVPLRTPYVYSGGAVTRIAPPP